MKELFATEVLFFILVIGYVAYLQKKFKGIVGPIGPQGLQGIPGTSICPLSFMREAGLLDGEVTEREIPNLNGDCIYNIVVRDYSGCNSGQIGTVGNGVRYNLNLRNNKLTIYDPAKEWSAYEIIILR